MRQLAVQVLLIVGTLAVSWRLLLGYGQRAQALRRIGLLVFAAFAVWSILDPAVWTRLAGLVGIGRGADLILYGLVVAFFSFVVTTFKRFREMEIRYTRLARRIAIDETLPPTVHPNVPQGALARASEGRPERALEQPVEAVEAVEAVEEQAPEPDRRAPLAPVTEGKLDAAPRGAADRTPS